MKFRLVFGSFDNFSYWKKKHISGKETIREGGVMGPVLPPRRMEPGWRFCTKKKKNKLSSWTFYKERKKYVQKETT